MDRCAGADQQAAGTATAADAATSTTGNGAYLDKIASSISTTLSDVRHAVTGFGSEAKTSVEEALKAGTRLSLASLGMLVSLVNGASRVSGAGTDLLEATSQRVSSLTSKVPVLGTVTSGVEHAVTTVGDTYRQTADFGVKKRLEMMKAMRTDLNKYQPGSEPEGDSVHAPDQTPVPASG